ncbi:hypothetical protein [Leptospira perdikensis]|uniref:DUF4912 domain-containing protein n=1 Tax=Leptospira perdikensis TaxID=2484948 RepID=A0A4V3JPQ6_9LEPT|nr:hypothetical protein [Leptospira perdikensis]TGL45952.1 hypothetical protein EHQ49_00770 [Leptospira perdikensis]
MANEEKKDGPVKKSAPKKKKPSATATKKSSKTAAKKAVKPEEIPSPKSPLKSIYNDSKFTSHPEFPPEDLIRVLVRTPKEAFVFWKFSEKTMKSLLDELETTSTDGLHFRLKVEYKNIFGSERTEFYELAPYTESYYLKFMFPVRDIQTYILVSYHKKEISALHSSGKDLPGGTESFRLDKEWIHPKWIELGIVAKSMGNDEYYFKDGDASEFYVNPRKVGPSESSADPNQTQSRWGNGSGSGKGLL